MRKFETFNELDTHLAYYGLNNIAWEVVELIKWDIEPHNLNKAKKTFVGWWNDLKIKPSITQHRLSYFCLYHLRKEYNKLRLGKC